MIRKERGKQRSPTNPVVLHTRKKQLRDHADVNTLPLVGPLRDPMACCSSDALSRRTTSARADLSSWISSSCIWTLCSREAMRSVTSILLAADALSSEDTHVRDEENVTKLKAESFLSHTITCKSGCVTDDRNCFIHSRMPIEHILWHAGRTVLKTSKARVGLKKSTFLTNSTFKIFCLKAFNYFQKAMLGSGFYYQLLLFKKAFHAFSFTQMETIIGQRKTERKDWKRKCKARVEIQTPFTP